MTPFEAWSGHKPYVTHFRIFGSRAWARIPTERGRICSPKAKSVYLLGAVIPKVEARLRGFKLKEILFYNVQIK